MTTPNTLTARRGPSLTARLAASAAALLALLAGCGGGVGSGGTGTYAAGPITGFGSIIVNGVRFDESAATVLDDDDASRTRGELRLGMTVAVDGGDVRSDAAGRTATATRVRFGSEIVGPVTAVDAAAGTLVVLGQTVAVAVDTVLDDRLSGGIVRLAFGQGIEVYALYDAASGRYKATRIEPRSALTQWTLRGPVAALDSVGKTLRIGGAEFGYAAAAGVPPDLAVGRIVRLRLQAGVDASGRFTVTSFGTGLRTPEDRDGAELEGLITAITSTASFQVNGLPVDASAASFPDGTSGIRLGARVDAKGRLRNGVLVASTVEIESDERIDDRGFEFKGQIAEVNLVAKTIVVRGQTISWARSDLVLEGGTLANLVVGRSVEVKARLAADRSTLEATKIEFQS
jgi:hypothetical protein